MSDHIAHWDDVAAQRREYGPLCGSWADLGRAAGSVSLGLRRIVVDPGKRSTPAHVHAAEEEVFYILGGRGRAWLGGDVMEIERGDAVICAASGDAHTLIADDEGLDVLAFGTRVTAELCRLPRADVGWLGESWVSAGDGQHPWRREIEAGELDMSNVVARDRRVVSVAQVATQEGGAGDAWACVRDLVGDRLLASGLRHWTVAAGKIGCFPHVHSAEEELFVVLEGEGFLELFDCRQGASEPNRIAVRGGHVISRPAGSGVAHALRAGEEGLTYLAYGTRESRDISYMPRSHKLCFRGLGIIVPAQAVDYWSGEV